ncbi:hypothetical protein MGU_00443 [Metarhizium guizhouense ARSEF 977]|uniref:Uncharacterized protein n=1 Tax=Metarhizium guizhouense (strain ARSEF 977) TaxID=1276136 RepID=A0A0B4ICW8_METGA|nr:hypothetical protein MGU_00443 [Metarhizium guizhouense ARSEF 977]
MMEAHNTRSSDVLSETVVSTESVEEKWWHPMKKYGSTVQIIIAAILGVATGFIISTLVLDRPKLQPSGNCLVPHPDPAWLVALRSIVQRVTQVVKDGPFPMWFVGYFITMIVLVVVLSCILAYSTWYQIFAVAGGREQAVEKGISIGDKGDVPVEEAVADTGGSFNDDDLWWILLMMINWHFFWH